MQAYFIMSRCRDVRSVIFNISILACLILFVGELQADAPEFSFVRRVQLTLKSGLGSGTAMLLTAIRGDKFQIVLTGIEAVGIAHNQEMETRVSRKDFTLLSSVVKNVKTGEKIYKVKKKLRGGLLDPESESYIYTGYNDGNKVITEFTTEFKVVDFLSSFLVAAKYVHDKQKNPIDLSIIRDRTVKHVQMKINNDDTTNNDITVKLAVLDAPNKGLTYIISKTPDGLYYPSIFTLFNSEGVEIVLKGNVK